MKIEINRIKVTERIRKEVIKIDELASDIVENGLLNPITVMEIPNGEYQLLAGLRRLKAAEKLGYREIDVNVVSPADAEAALRIEISENEQREPFTFSEKMDFARMLEEIEQTKSKERMSLGGKGGLEQGTLRGAYVQRGETREIVAEKIGMGKTSYDRAKYIAENAPDEVIGELDSGKRSIRGTYEELRNKERDEQLPVIHEKTKSRQKPPKIQIEDYLSENDREAVRKLKEFNAMPPEEKIEEFKRQLKSERARAASAESELARLKELRHNDVFHKDGIIENLRARLKDLEEELTKATAQIQKCEQCKTEENPISAV